METRYKIVAIVNPRADKTSCIHVRISSGGANQESFGLADQPVAQIEAIVSQLIQSFVAAHPPAGA